MFRAAEVVSKDVLAATKEAIKANDQRLIALLNNPLKHDSGLFGHGTLTAETQADISEAYTLLAANYLLLRSVTGWPEIGLSADSIGLAGNSIAAALIEQAKDSFQRAGLTGEEADEVEA